MPGVDRLQERVRKLGGILDVAKALVAERDLDRLLQLIVQAASRVVEADRCSLFLVDRERAEMWSKIAQGVGTREIRFPMGKGIAGSVAETNVPINIPEAYADPRSAIEREKQLKKWSRAKKDALIAKRNPEWRDLLDEMYATRPVGGIR